MEIGEVYIVAETGKFFQVRGIYDDYVEISMQSDYYSSAKTVIRECNAPVSYGYVESAIRVIALDTMPGVFHNGIGWKHLMTEKDPQHPKMYSH